MKKIVIFLVFGFFVSSLVYVPQASACSCVEPTPGQSYNDADYVFSGLLQEVQTLNEYEYNEQKIIATFEVDKYWKGPSSEEAVLHTVYNTFTCNGYFFDEGTEYLVYAFLAEDQTFYTTVCSGTKKLDFASDDLAYLGSGNIPEEEPAPDPNPEPESDPEPQPEPTPEPQQLEPPTPPTEVTSEEEIVEVVEKEEVIEERVTEPELIEPEDSSESERPEPVYTYTQGNNNNNKEYPEAVVVSESDILSQENAKQPKNIFQKFWFFLISIFN